MNIDIISVFPQYFDILNLSLLGKAQEKGLVNVDIHDLRNWTHDVHHSVDDTPVGGGAGMVMKPQVWGEALDDIVSDDAVLIFANPAAPQFTQHDAQSLSEQRHLVFGCGRYEGYDARVPEFYKNKGIDVREYSIGDYVLNGGEVAVCVMIEAITRLLPNFMGNHDSIVEESYTGANALLEHNQYTKPAAWRDLKVPAVLLSGDHGKVDRFRRDEALKKTHDLRPDMIEALDCHALDKADRKTLMALGWEVSGEHPTRR